MEKAKAVPEETKEEREAKSKAAPVKKANPESEEGDLEPVKKTEEEEKEEEKEELAAQTKEDPPAAAAAKEAAPAEEGDAAKPTEKVHAINPTDW